MFWSKNKKNKKKIPLKSGKFLFFKLKKSLFIAWASFRNAIHYNDTIFIFLRYQACNNTRDDPTCSMQIVGGKTELKLVHTGQRSHAGETVFRYNVIVKYRRVQLL